LITVVQAVDFITNPLDDDITGWVVVYFRGLQNHMVDTKSTQSDVIIDQIRDEIHSLYDRGALPGIAASGRSAVGPGFGTLLKGAARILSPVSNFSTDNVKWWAQFSQAALTFRGLSSTNNTRRVKLIDCTNLPSQKTDYSYFHQTI